MLGNLFAAAVQWPNPTESIGTEHRQLGRNTCWEAIGPAREQFVQLADDISNYLRKCSVAVEGKPGGGKYIVEYTVTWSVYMVGRNTDTARPIVFFCCQDRKSRKKVRNLIQESEILNRYPGFGTADISEPPDIGFLVAYAMENTLDWFVSGTFDSEKFVLCHPSNTFLGKEIYIEKLDGRTSKLRKATGGGIIAAVDESHNDVRYFYMTVAHAFTEIGASVPQGIPVDTEFEFSIDGESDEDENHHQLEVVTSRGSVSPEGSQLDSDTSTGDNLSSDSQTLRVKNAPNQRDPLESRLHSGDRLTKKAKPPDDSDPARQDDSELSLVKLGLFKVSSLDGPHVGLDYALIEITAPHILAFPIFNEIALSDEPDPPVLFPDEIASITPKDAAVIAVTGSSGPVRGSLLGRPSFLTLPHSENTQEVWNVRLDRPLVQGDCGSWVIDAQTGKLYGHIIAGGHKTGAAYIIPAFQTFNDIRNRLKSDEINKIELPTRSRNNSPADIEERLYSSLCYQTKLDGSSRSYPNIPNIAGGFSLEQAGPISSDRIPDQSSISSATALPSLNLPLPIRAMGLDLPASSLLPQIATVFFPHAGIPQTLALQKWSTMNTVNGLLFKWIAINGKEVLRHYVPYGVFPFTLHQDFHDADVSFLKTQKLIFTAADGSMCLTDCIVRYKFRDVIESIKFQSDVHNMDLVGVFNCKHLFYARQPHGRGRESTLQHAKIWRMRQESFQHTLSFFSEREARDVEILLDELDADLSKVTSQTVILNIVPRTGTSSSPARNLFSLPHRGASPKNKTPHLSQFTSLSSTSSLGTIGSKSSEDIAKSLRYIAVEFGSDEEALDFLKAFRSCHRADNEARSAGVADPTVRVADPTVRFADPTVRSKDVEGSYVQSAGVEGPIPTPPDISDFYPGSSRDFSFRARNRYPYGK